MKTDLVITKVLFPECIAESHRKPIKEALLLHNANFSNATFDDCVWRRERETCPDPDVKLHLYTEGATEKQVVSCLFLRSFEQSLVFRQYINSVKKCTVGK